VIIEFGARNIRRGIPVTRWVVYIATTSPTNLAFYRKLLEGSAFLKERGLQQFFSAR
jgi:hypothetical protein